MKKCKFEIIDGKCVIPEGVTEIQNRSFSNCDKLKEVSLPSTVKCIHNEAFYDCWGLTSVEISAGVTTIEPGAFLGCPGIETIRVAEDNPVYKSETNCCLTKDCKTLIFGGKSSIIPNTVETIARSAFQWCEELAAINIPASVKSIGSHAFAKCGRREWVKIPSTVEYLGADVSSIYVPEEIVIPDKLEPAPKDPYELPF